MDKVYQFAFNLLWFGFVGWVVARCLSAWADFRQKVKNNRFKDGKH